MSPHRERHRCDISCQEARMGLPSSSLRATGTCMCCPNPCTVPSRSNRPQEREPCFIPGTASWSIFHILQSRPNTLLRGITPRYIIVFVFETSTPNLMWQQKDHLLFQPCRPHQRKIIFFIGIILKKSVVAVSDSSILFHYARSSPLRLHDYCFPTTDFPNSLTVSLQLVGHPYNLFMDLSHCSRSSLNSLLSYQ